MQGGEANGGGGDAVVGHAGDSDRNDGEACASSTGAEIERAATWDASSAGTHGALTTYILEPTSVSMEYAICRPAPALRDDQAHARAAMASAPLISLSVMASDVEGNLNPRLHYRLLTLCPRSAG